MASRRSDRVRVLLALAGAVLFVALAVLVFARPPAAVPYAMGKATYAQADDGPTPDDEPAVEEEDDNGDDADGDVAPVPEAEEEDAHETHAPSPTTAPSATSAATTAAPPRGKALGDGTYLAPFTESNGVKVFRLTMMPIKLEVAAGQVFDAFSFNGIVPGPVLRVNEGDRVRVVVKNDLPISTGVHWHGMILPNAQDGIPGLTQPSIDPGETYTYNWTAIAAGTHWYHSHSSGSDIGKGLYGALEVVPRSGDFKVDRDYRLIVGDTNLGFVLNGKAYPYTTPLAARVGEKVRIRLIAAGDLSHPMHLHGMTFTVVAQDGLPMEHPVRMDTLLISAGQTFDIITQPINEGRWLLHCHIFAHSHSTAADAVHDMNAPVGRLAMGMNGITTTLDVSPSSTSTQALAMPAEPPAVSESAAAVPAERPAIATETAGSSSGDLGAIATVAVVILAASAAIVLTTRRSRA